MARRGKFLTPPQYKFLSEFCRETSQTILLVAMGGYFLPPAIGLQAAVSLKIFLKLAISGLTLLTTGVILIKRGEK